MLHMTCKELSLLLSCQDDKCSHNAHQVADHGRHCKASSAPSTSSSLIACRRPRGCRYCSRASVVAAHPQGGVCLAHAFPGTALLHVCRAASQQQQHTLGSTHHNSLQRLPASSAFLPFHKGMLQAIRTRCLLLVLASCHSSASSIGHAS
jgi:hypothetical protein